MPRVSKLTLQMGFPTYRARYTPFGLGLVTVAQRSDFVCRLWRFVCLFVFFFIENCFNLFSFNSV